MHRLVEDELDRQEEERNKRMNIIGQNGNDGEHYETESKFTDTITVNGTSAIWVPKNYNLNVIFVSVKGKTKENSFLPLINKDSSIFLLSILDKSILWILSNEKNS